MTPVLPGAISGTHLLLILAIAAIAVAAPYLTRLAREKRRDPPSGGASHAEEWPSRERIRRTADKALVDLVETGREISAQIDTRIRILNKLVRDADAAAERLERLQRGESAQSAPVRAAPPEAEAEKSGEAGPPRGAEPAPPPGAELRTAAATPAPLAASPASRSALHERVAALAAEGRSAEAIARDLRLSTSEVRLALHLLRQGAGGESGVHPSDHGQPRAEPSPPGTARKDPT
jgi:hypothetical protein